MIKIFYIVCLLLFFYNSSTKAQNNYRFSITAVGTYISGSTLQDNYKSSDPINRDAELQLTGGYGYGFEISYDPRFYNSGVRITLGSEYLKIRDTELEYFLDNGADNAKVRMIEEITFIPVEAGLKWDLPVSTKELRIYIGGGAGIYFGDRIRTIDYLESSTVSTDPGYSITISSGLDFYFTRNFSANFEFKFRDASFDVESRYEDNFIVADGNTFLLDNPFYSRLLIDGVRISLGLKYLF